MALRVRLKFDFVLQLNINGVAIIGKRFGIARRELAPTGFRAILRRRV